MNHMLAKIKEFSFHFLDLLFILEYEHIETDHAKKSSLKREPLSDSNSIQ
ncbi:hypothetical protein [Halalkalibacter wakoensis]|nr:hypothetical protein [Halalkalibacter wakoensis]